MTTKQKQKS